MAFTVSKSAPISRAAIATTNDDSTKPIQVNPATIATVKILFIVYSFRGGRDRPGSLFIAYSVCGVKQNYEALEK